MSREEHERLSTADLVAGTSQPQQRPDATPRQAPPRSMGAGEVHEERMPEPLPPDAAQDLQARQPPDARQMQPMPSPQSGSAVGGMPDAPVEQLADLFPPEKAAEFRSRWDAVQIGFVDDPREAVRKADELVAEMMKNLAAGFAEQRARLESGLGRGDQSAQTENLRMALRAYRSFFQRLLTL